ncbi:MAG: prepilin-type N-terminal cleavage/methylation domain-containing protein [Candidatus Omnitrophica bacterium]|nr:prepilin-type N-terminal cleavage/methylation domain-containing protein [Candidatus Omnitrophota bacterium]
MLKYKISSAAFSLLEVLVAIAIFATGTVVVVQSISYSSRSTAITSDMLQASCIAQDVIQELELKQKYNLLSQIPQTLQETKGQFSYGYSLGNADTTTNLTALHFEISWKRVKRQELFIINSYLHK